MICKYIYIYYKLDYVLLVSTFLHSKKCPKKYHSHFSLKTKNSKYRKINKFVNSLKLKDLMFYSFES